MSDHVYKTIEITGSSAKGFDAAVERAISKASETVRHLRWFKVIETRGEIDGKTIGHWQVTLKIGFTLDD